jgi:hypothetical protein
VLIVVARCWLLVPAEELFNRYKSTFAPQRKIHFVDEPKGARGTKKDQ